MKGSSGVEETGPKSRSHAFRVSYAHTASMSGYATTFRKRTLLHARISMQVSRSMHSTHTWPARNSRSVLDTAWTGRFYFGVRPNPLKRDYFAAIYFVFIKKFRRCSGSIEQLIRHKMNRITKLPIASLSLNFTIGHLSYLVFVCRQYRRRFLYLFQTFGSSLLICRTVTVPSRATVHRYVDRRVFLSIRCTHTADLKLQRIYCSST